MIFQKKKTNFYFLMDKDLSKLYVLILTKNSKKEKQNEKKVTAKTTWYKYLIKK